MAQVNISNIKTQIKSILDAANTTTGSPIDLSAGLDTRVQQVLKVHPAKVPIDAGSFPWVSMYLESKNIEQLTIGHKGSQASALRQAELNINLACAVQEPLIVSVKEDQGDENCERLVENIEEVLRSNSDLNASVDWSFPEEAQFHDEPWDERNQIRGALLTLRCKVFY